MKQHGLTPDGEQIILHRFHGGVEVEEPADDSPTHRFLFVDVEATGLEPGTDQVIELAIARVDVQIETGRVVGHAGTDSWFEDPGRPIPPEIVELTGIQDADVRGHRIPDDLVRGYFAEASVVVAHNARYDRAMSMRRFDWLAAGDMPPWSCSLNQIDWRGYGHRHANLENLAMDHGFFYTGHRATIDVEALVKLVSMRPEPTAGPYLCDLVADTRQPYYFLAASGTPFEAKDELRQRGFRWDPDRKHWYTALPESRLADELDWVREGCGRWGRGRPVVAKVPFSQRFADDFEPEWQGR